jgi:hypothetical protein
MGRRRGWRWGILKMMIRLHEWMDRLHGYRRMLLLNLGWSNVVTVIMLLDSDPRLFGCRNGM